MSGDRRDQGEDDMRVRLCSDAWLQGIGNGIVGELAALGANVFTCSRTEADLQDCLQAWRKQGFIVQGVVADMSKEEDRIMLIKKAEDFFEGKLDVLVNNVGTNVRKTTVEYGSEVEEMRFEQTSTLDAGV